MHLGKNIKLVAVFEYKNKSLIVNKHAFINKKEINILNGEQYKNIDKKDYEEGKLYYTPAIITAINLKPYSIYTDDDLKLIVESNNIEFGNIKGKEKVKTRR